MSSCRDSASAQAQQISTVCSTLPGFAQQQLADRGEFFPYAAAVGTDGEVEMVAARPDADDEHPRSADVLDACVAALVS